MPLPTHPQSIPVTYKKNYKNKPTGEQWDAIETIEISEPVPLAKGNETEEVLRASMGALTGIHQQVMSDLYRHLVITNFTGLTVSGINKSKRGGSASADLDRIYPDHHTLPKLKGKSHGFNTSGAIISILLEPQETYADAFGIVGGILYSLLEKRILDKPKLDAVTAPALPTPESEDLEPPLPDRVRMETYRILRDTEVARRVKRMHQYKCQMCECNYTMQLPNGTGYAEAHHIQPLGGNHKGKDVIGNILCLCPNHHAELDYGIRAISLATLHCIDGHEIGKQYVEYHNREIHKPGSA
jgi:hypothetical protein